MIKNTSLRAYTKQTRKPGLGHFVRNDGRDEFSCCAFPAKAGIFLGPRLRSRGERENLCVFVAKNCSGSLFFCFETHNIFGTHIKGD